MLRTAEAVICSVANGAGSPRIEILEANPHIPSRESPLYAESNIARRSAHYCIACLSDEDYLPVVDFRAPNEKGRYDSTAGMIIASGLLELSEYVTEYERNLYSNSAFKILKACDEKFNNWNPDEDSIVSGGSLRYHDDKMAGASIIYGDYFLTECILRLEGKFSRIW